MPGRPYRQGLMDKQANAQAERKLNVWSFTKLIVLSFS